MGADSFTILASNIGSFGIARMTLSHRDHRAGRVFMGNQGTWEAQISPVSNGSANPKDNEGKRDGYQ